MCVSSGRLMVRVVMGEMGSVDNYGTMTADGGRASLGKRSDECYRENSTKASALVVVPAVSRSLPAVLSDSLTHSHQLH